MFEQLKEDFAIARAAMSFNDYQDHTETWEEPTARDMAIVCAASFAFWMFLFWGAF